MTDPSEDFLAESTAGVIRGIFWASAVIPCIFVVLRTYVRLRLKRTFGLDDMVAIVAVVCYINYLSGPFTKTVRLFKWRTVL